MRRAGESAGQMKKWVNRDQGCYAYGAYSEGGQQPRALVGAGIALSSERSLDELLKRLDGGPLLQFAFCALGLCVISGIAYGRDKLQARFDL